MTVAASAPPSVRFEVADPRSEDDDRELRRLVATNAVPGRVTLSFEREPSFFAGCASLGSQWQVIVGRAHGRIVGLTCRAVRSHYVNGEPRRLGYLGQLRIDPAFRGRSLIARGFRYLRALEQQHPVDGYLATITSENETARGLLVDHRRESFPVFREIAELHTLALFVRGRGAAGAADPADLAEVTAFLNAHGRCRQFFPVYAPADFAPFGIHPKDVLVERGPSGSIRGVMAVADQTAFKQTVVRGYDPMLRRLRPLVNAAARLAGMPRPPLPAIGQQLASVYASLVCVADNDPRTFARLLRRAYGVAAARGSSYLLVGLPSHDPLLSTARGYPHLTYRSRLYLATWNGGARELFARLDPARLPYVEIGAL